MEGSEGRKRNKVKRRKTVKDESGERKRRREGRKERQKEARKSNRSSNL
jgi:hypothetical protein